MKKLRTVLVATAMLFSTSIFASNEPEKVSAKIKAVFEKDFANAAKVSWEKTDDYYFAYFELDAKQTSAAYNEAGDLLGVSRVIATAALPLNVSMAIAQKYDGYLVAKTATEITFEGQTSYYVTIENEKQKLRLKYTASNGISVENKTKK